MIPFLGSNRKQKQNPDGSLRWIKTKADDELADCNNFSIDFLGSKYPVWKFIEMYLRIRTKDPLNPAIPLRLNDSQIKTYKVWDEQMGRLGYVRCNEGKGRQMGSSTLICAALFCIAITHPGYRVGILADTEAKGIELLNKYRFFYENLHPAYREKLKLATDNAKNMEFDFGDGIIGGITVLVANETAGASYTFHAIHASEVALWDNIDKTLMVLEATVGAEPYTFIVRETTARGPNEWKGHFETGLNGKSDFVSVFLGWYLMDDYRLKYDGHELSEYERMLRDELHLDLDQIQWWKTNFHKANDELALMKQEYPSTPAEMWQSTSVSIFNAELTAVRKERTAGTYIKRGIFEYEKPYYETEEYDSPIHINSYVFLKDEYGSVSIYEEPIDGHPYALVNDPANGGEDYHATVVVDCSNDKQVAVYHERKVDADKAAFCSYCLWLYYKRGGIDGNLDNRVFVSGERNLTNYWLQTMRRLGAGPISIDRQESESGAYVDHLGWRTTPSNRKKMIDEFAVAFRLSLGLIVNDFDTVCEMESFQYQKSGIMHAEKAMAIGGAHDDLVMAYCGYFHCKNRGDFECNIVKRVAEKHGVPFDPFRRNTPQKTSHFMNW